MESPHESSVYDFCAASLREEAALAARIAEIQGLVRAAVIRREWTDFEGHLAELARLGEEFAALDLARQRYFATATGAPEAPGVQSGREGGGGFYALVSRFPPEARREICALYRQLKLGILKIRLENEALARYLNEGQTTVAAFLDAAFPDRKGRLYSRRGKQVPPDMRSILLNRHF
jgi:hypothetical protein